MNVSLVAPASTTIQEVENAKVDISISLDSTVSTSITVPLNFSGSASRDADYAASAESVVIPPNTESGNFIIDVFRDFDAEGDESITIGLGEIGGNGRLGPTTSIELIIVDGETVSVDKTTGDESANLAVFNTRYIVTEQSVDFDATVINRSNQAIAPAYLHVIWSNDEDFATNINSLGSVDTPAFFPDTAVFPDTYEFSLPLYRLVPNETYYILVSLDKIPEETRLVDLFDNSFQLSFATNAQGKVITRCEAPVRVPSGTGSDPLFAEQWHLENRGQTGFSRNNGVEGADMQMTAAIANGQNGRGAKVAIVDTGLEICHPDLAANVDTGKSFNFDHLDTAGSSSGDPFNFSLTGDHGTSVAGVVAAVANNGLGGRGVAPDAELRGFGLGASPGADFDVRLLKSLGASTSNPDSASTHIFNMSLGYHAPAANADKDFIELVEMGTADLRSGLGALYVKAAGNDFDFCASLHPLNAEIGCIGGNADPFQNLPYLITVGGFNAGDVKSSYSNAGANLWVVAPSGEDGEEDPGIVTTDQIGAAAGYRTFSADSLTASHPLNLDGDYTSAFGGTSSAAPAASGAIAILLGVNPDLTWRDVKHVLATTARKIDADIPEVRAAFDGKPYIAQHAWQTNSAGYSYHNWYGFGAIAIDNAVAMAADHTPDSLGAFVESPWFSTAENTDLSLAIPDGDGAGITHTLAVTDLPNAANIEAVILELSIDHGHSPDLGIGLISPSGTESILNPPFNVILGEVPGISDWQLMSNAFYGEEPGGIWTIQVVDLLAGDSGSLASWRLRFYYGDHP